LLLIRLPPSPTLFPYTTLFRSKKCNALPGPPGKAETSVARTAAGIGEALPCFGNELPVEGVGPQGELQDAKGCRIAQLAVGLRKDRKSSRLNSSHVAISYAVFC